MYEKLLSRRSVRKYTAEQVNDELLDAVLKAGLYAPTAKNNQKPVMVAVRDKETRDLLSKINAEIMGIETDPFYGAPCVIVVLADPEFPTWIDDGSLVMGNLLNAANALNLGSCWINRARETFDRPEGKELLKKWGLPEHFRGVGNCILGFAAEEPALKERLEHPIFGYPVEPEDFKPSICDWVRNQHGWDVRKEWLCFIPGIVKGIGMAINALLEKDEKVIIQPPVFHPLRIIPQKNQREVVYNPLKETPTGYEMDFENLAAVCDEKCRMLILANPHNPAGIVWSRETLARLAEFCHKKGIIVISDEIHCDMALFGNKHIPFASVSEEAAGCSITFGAPSKTFNIAGIVSSYAIVPNQELRERFFIWLEASEMSAPHLFAPIATMAAFRHGENWRKQMLGYVEGNIEFIEDFCAQNIPQIRPIRPQASFLVWLDCRKLGIPHAKLVDLFVNKAKLALNDGAMFGSEGEGFMRLNIGTTRAILTQALTQLKSAIEGLDTED